MDIQNKENNTAITHELTDGEENLFLVEPEPELPDQVETTNGKEKLTEQKVNEML